MSIPSRTFNPADVPYPFESYQLKVGDNFAQIIAYFDDSGGDPLPLPTRARLDIRDTDGGVLLLSADSDESATADGSIAIAAATGGGIQLAIDIPGDATAEVGAGLRVVGDIRMWFAPGSPLPSPWTPHMLDIKTYPSNIEADA